MKAAAGILGNLADQTNNPCFDNVNWSQATASAIFNATGGPAKLALGNKFQGSGAKYVTKQAISQWGNGKIVTGL